MLTKFIYTSKNRWKQNITWFSTEEIIQGLSIKKKTFIDYSQTADYVCENLDDYNAIKKGKVLIVFDDILADMKVIKN